MQPPYRVQVLHVNKHQHSSNAAIVHRPMSRDAAHAGRRTHADRAAGADEDAVAQHPVTSGDEDK